MWLKRLISTYYGNSPTGGAGSQTPGVASGDMGQGSLFVSPDIFELDRQRKRNKKRKINHNVH